jgi:hypothetical protein
VLKKIGIPVLALFALMVVVSPPQANAAVRFGVVIGGPVYRAPVPVSSYPYVAPDYGYGYGYGYVAPAPYGYYGGGYGYRDHDRYYDRGYRGGREFRGHDGGHYRR